MGHRIIVRQEPRIGLDNTSLLYVLILVNFKNNHLVTDKRAAMPWPVRSGRARTPSTVVGATDARRVPAPSGSDARRTRSTGRATRSNIRSVEIGSVILHRRLARRGTGCDSDAISRLPPGTRP